MVESSNFWSHLANIERENETEKFTNGQPRQFYTREGLHKRLHESGWCRIWTAKVDGRIVAHASLFDIGEPDRICGGMICVESAHRGQGIYTILQHMRLRYCDQHGLTLVGVVTEANQKAIAIHEKHGYTVLKYDPELKETWMMRAPVARIAP